MIGSRIKPLVSLVLAFATLLMTGCARRADQTATSATPGEKVAVKESTPETSTPNPNLVPISDAATADLLRIKEPFTGDLDGVCQRKFLRALVVYDRTTYFIDRADQRGIAYDALMEFEKTLRAHPGCASVKVAIIPTGRDPLLKSLAAGYGDVAIGNLTVTPERQNLVDFTDPVLDQVKELVVTGPTAPEIKSLDDLSGKEVQVLASSSHRESIDALNQRFRGEGKAPIKIKPADQVLTDEDLIQLTDAGVIGITLLDDHIARFWSQLYDRAKVREDLVVRPNGQISWAIRKNAPGLKSLMNEFVKTHRVGTMFGNMMLKRYLGSADRLKNPTAEAELNRFRSMAADFKKFGDQYQFPWRLIAAQGYQESTLDQSKRSPAGAVGVMQIKPATAADVGIKNIENSTDNIQAGTKYLRYILDKNFKEAPMDRLNQGLFAFASYNAGPARVAELRKKAEAQGLNPNVWFNNVEIVAAKEIGRETVDYVSNIYKYYTAYVAIGEQRSVRGKSAKIATE